MRLPRSLSGNNFLAIGVLLCVCCSVFVSALPQWVWNPDAETGPKNSIGSGDRLIYGGQIASRDDDKDKVKYKLEDAQGRLFLPSLVNAISGGGRPGNMARPTTSRPSSSSMGGGDPPVFPDNSNSGGGGGDSNGSGQGEGMGMGMTEGADGSSDGSGDSCKTGTCIGGSSQATEQGMSTPSVADNYKYEEEVNGVRISNFRRPLGGISGIFTNFLQNIFGTSASTLPAGLGGSGIGGGSSGGSSGSGGSGAACTCEEKSRGCFLPQREVGGCDSGTRVRCCQNVRSSRTIFPEDDNGATSTTSVKSVTRSQLRRGLLKNIVRGSGSIIDDTLDLILHPFLTEEDRNKVATRVLSNE